MKNPLSYLIACLVIGSILMISGCSDYTTGSKIYTRVDFSKFKTYAWLPNVDSIEVNDVNHDQLFQSIAGTVDDELSAHGYSTDNLEPDFLVRVSLYVNFSNTLVSSQFYSYPRMLTVYNFFCSPEEYEYYPEQYYYHPDISTRLVPVTFRNGTLVINIINAKTGEPLWMGYAESSRQLTGEAPDPNRIRAKAGEVVKTIFKDFPVNTTQKVITDKNPL